jgi:hypothetical protein
METIKLSNGNYMSKRCKNREQYQTAYRLFKRGYSPEDALRLSRNVSAENINKRNKEVQIDVYFNTLCRINTLMKQEIDPAIILPKVQRIVDEAISGMMVIGYTNQLVDGGM